MSQRGIVWVDSPPALRIDGDGAEIEFKSGELQVIHRMSRANLRQMAECAIRALNGAETAEVITFPERECA